ncbi:hypothetical protein [Actinomycetospora cinnamomea]|uniref:Uncharacterized protein n=1 Tax=Actinomycetospora cinnamomea TaxID=663609 RepID=A0A2U1F2I3_9PSEU|nr:hypothetical protein [Actinomycetospora cinnamomea]PVZ06393.1 hypothetical protein C8D89_113131 [Actinomycetospora cinnamomea]
MDLRQRLVHLALRRPHALLVEVPGWWRTRVETERAMARRGWRPASSPAGADVLVVCGSPGADLGEVVDRVTDQLPGPRARVAATAPEEVATALDEAAARLADERAQRDDARDRTRADRADRADQGGDGGDDGGDDGGEDGGEDGGDDEDDGDSEMAPEGIPLAGSGPDRDGLEMDVLNVPLGPVLEHWPAGLVLRCVLQGDVVVEADVDVLAGGAAASPSATAAVTCDGAARALDLAGWGDAAAGVRRVRDLVLDGHHDQARRDLDRLAARVARSRVLRWSLRDLGRLDPAQARAHGLPDDAVGDVHDRLVAMLERARDGLAGRSDAAGDRSAVVEALPTLVHGLELAAVRLVVASHDPDTLGASRQERADA